MKASLLTPLFLLCTPLLAAPIIDDGRIHANNGIYIKSGLSERDVDTSTWFKEKPKAKREAEEETNRDGQVQWLKRYLHDHDGIDVDGGETEEFDGKWLKRDLDQVDQLDQSVGEDFEREIEFEGAEGDMGKRDVDGSDGEDWFKKRDL